MSTVTIPESTRLETDDLMTAEEFLEQEMGPLEPRSTSPEPTESPIDFQPSTPPSPHFQIPRDPRSRVLPRLLGMADAYLKTGALRQALDMYFDLYRNHEDSPEAVQAEDRILEVARIHEQNGELHLARAIYEQLI